MWQLDFIKHEIKLPHTTLVYRGGAPAVVVRGGSPAVVVRCELLQLLEVMLLQL